MFGTKILTSLLIIFGLTACKTSSHQAETKGIFGTKAKPFLESFENQVVYHQDDANHKNCPSVISLLKTGDLELTIAPFSLEKANTHNEIQENPLKPQAEKLINQLLFAQIDSVSTMEQDGMLVNKTKVLFDDKSDPEAVILTEYKGSCAQVTLGGCVLFSPRNLSKQLILTRDYKFIKISLFNHAPENEQKWFNMAAIQDAKKEVNCFYVKE